MVTVCRLDQVDKAVRNTLAVVPQPIADPHTVAITVALDGEIETHACNARRRLQQLRDDQRRLHRHITTIARELAETGYTYRDIAYLLGITYGRVGQILTRTRTTPTPP